MLIRLAATAPLHRGVEVGIVEDDEGRFAAQLQVSALEARGGGFRHPHAHLRRAGERHHAHQRMTHQRLPATAPTPVITLKTPGGNPTSAASSASMSVVRGVSSLGLITIVLPAATAGSNFQAAICSG